MKHSTISLRRRHLMLAGLASAAAPGALFASQCIVTSRDPFAPPTVAEVSATPSGGNLLVSGRVVGADCRPLAGALVEVWTEGTSERASVTTDADGRFMLTTTATIQGRPRPFQIRVSYGQRRLVQQLDLAPERGVSDDRISQLQRDDTGIWRTTLGLTLA